MSREIFKIPTEYISRISPCANTLPEYRNEFMRDRDRIMYCTAFRRLDGKTQIYTIGSDDHKKNRLTHSLEVAQIARTISTALGLNEELAEAMALGHDLGHTPFGHAGEIMLHNIMCPKSTIIKDSPFIEEADKLSKTLERESTLVPNDLDMNNMFGFKHNIQSVRVSTLIEDSYRGANGENIGLNLTNYTLWGILNHSKIQYNNTDSYPNYQNQFQRHIQIKGSDKDAWSFEAFVVEWADDIAQWHHDLEDAIRGNALPMKSICELIVNACGNKLQSEDTTVLNSIKTMSALDRRSVAELSHIVVNTLITDLINSSSVELDKIEEKMSSRYSGKGTEEQSKILFSNVSCLEEDGISMKKAIRLSEEINTSIFKETIKNSVHHSKDVQRMNSKGNYIIKKLFEAYSTHPQQLPDGIILHFMVDIGKYSTIEKAKEKGMGIIRTEFENVMHNPKTIYKCQLMRRICDHIACMTDRYAIDEYNNLYG